MHTRRSFLKKSLSAGIFGATSGLMGSAFSSHALAQLTSGPYKAIVVIELEGGNDANNMLIPMDSALYAEYATIRQGLALPQSSLIPLQSTSGSPSYGLHPSMVNVAKLYNQKRAAVVANVGPITAPTTKQGLLSGKVALPDSPLSHTNGIMQWESASAYNGSTTGWGGRLADVLAGQSGILPPVLNASSQSLFTVGNTVQAVAVQGGAAFPALPVALQSAINDLATIDLGSKNPLIAQAATVRQASLAQQQVLINAAAYRQLQTPFGGGFSQTMQTIAQIIAGRSVIGANRQIFYTTQGSYDFHANQLSQHVDNLTALDQALGSFFAAMDELGLSDQVLVCTHSDFNRTYTSNVDGGSDHGWGTHQLLIGGVNGGQILGTMPTLELNGPDDSNGMGIWIPTTAAVQLTAGIGSWMGLNSSQLNTVFPELINFPKGPLALS